jgi:CelD/BcsL family acetyltransferase involved in cellulose biosynthesis
MFQVKIIDSLDSLYQIKKDWDNLYLQSSISYPFLTFEWISTWWKFFGGKNRLFVLLVIEYNEIIAIAPFMYTERILRGIPLKTITFLSNYHSNRIEMILLRQEFEVINFIINYLFNVSPKIDLIELGFIPEGCSCEKILDRVLEKQRLKYLKFVDFSSPYISINDQWDNYLKKRSKKLRRKLNSLHKKYKELNNYKILRFSDCYEDECMKKIFKISKKTWKDSKKSAIVSKKETLNFYTSFAQLATKREWLDILILTIEEIPVAFEYKLHYNLIDYCLKIGYDLDYQSYSPGQFLMARSIQNAFEDGCQEFDFVGDKARFKMEWTNLLRNHFKYLVFSKSFLGACAGFLEINIIRQLRLNCFYNKIKQKIN